MLKLTTFSNHGIKHFDLGAKVMVTVNDDTDAAVMKLQVGIHYAESSGRENEFCGLYFE